MKIQLTSGELGALLSQDPDSAADGGFQNFLVQLGRRADNQSGELELDDQDLSRISKYATGYGRGGYQTRMFKIFHRSLSQELNWPAV